MAASKWLLVALLVSGAARGGVAQEVAPSPPPCTPLQEAVWSRIATDQLGLSVRDATADRRYTGPLANFKKGAGLRRGQLGGRNWFPADVVKRTLCGRLDRFELFYTPVSDHEADFHPFIDAFPPYRYLTDDLQPITTDSLPTYGEITLPGGIWTNPPWFTLPRGRSFSSQVVRSPAAEGGLEGSPFCIYGPWVFEDFHSNQPEIHPAQQMWWRVPGGDEVRWLLAQDISNRFQKEMYYCDVEGDASEQHCDEARPAEFVAWAPPSISGEALVAYELDAAAPQSRNITVFLDRSDGTGPGDPTALDTRRFAVPGGLSQLTVAHPPNRPASGDGVTGMSVVFQARDECVASTPDRILGYVAVRVVVDRGSAREGYAQVGVRGRPRRTDWPASEPHGPAAAGTPVVGLEKRSLIRNGAVLLGAWRPGGTEEALTLSGPAGTEQIRRRDGAFEVPFLGRPGPLEAQLGDRKFSVPQVRLHANFTGFYRWRMSEPSVRTNLRVTYSSTREMGGELLAEQLNETLVDTGWTTTADVARNRARFQRVFGDDGCFQARLSATATPADGSAIEVPVEEGGCTGSVPPTGPPVRVCAMDRDQGCHWFLHDEIVDVQVRARPGFRGTVQLAAAATDPFGTASPTVARRISFPLTHESSLNRLLEEAAATADLPSVAELHRLAALSRSGPAAAADALDLGTGLCGARERKARIVLLFARYVAADGGGTDDYNRLQALARELGALKDAVDPCAGSDAGRARRR
jgi:hypothetical protein